MSFTNYDDPPVGQPPTDLITVLALPVYERWAFFQWFDWNIIQERFDGHTVGPSPVPPDDLGPGQPRLVSPAQTIYILILYTIYDGVPVPRAEVVCGW